MSEQSFNDFHFLLDNQIVLTDKILIHMEIRVSFQLHFLFHFIPTIEMQLEKLDPTRAVGRGARDKARVNESRRGKARGSFF